jgi:hypothetical protein
MLDKIENIIVSCNLNIGRKDTTYSVFFITFKIIDSQSLYVNQFLKESQ